MVLNKNKKQLVLFFGNVRSNEYAVFQNAGYYLGLFFKKQHYLPRPAVDDFEFIFNFDHEMELEDLLRVYKDVSQRYNIVHHINVREDAVLQFARFSEAIGVISTSPKDAVNARDKTLMKSVFREKIGDFSTSMSTGIDTEDELIAFTEKQKLPLVLKPTNLHASKFVSINYSLDELLASYRKAARYVDKLNKMDRNQDVDLKAETFTSKSETTRLQVEAFMQGTNHSVDCIIDPSGTVYATPVVDVIVGLEIDTPDFHHFARLSPGRLTPEQDKEVREMAISGCKALNLKSCIAHVELIYTPTGPQLIEIAARPGGNRAEILKLSYGFELMELFLDCLEGRKPVINFEPLKQAAIVTPFPDTTGTVEKLYIDRLAKELSTLELLTVKVKEGDQVGPAIQGFTAPAYFWLCADDQQRIDEDVKRIASANIYQLQKWRSG